MINFYNIFQLISFYLDFTNNSDFDRIKNKKVRQWQDDFTMAVFPKTYPKIKLTESDVKVIIDFVKTKCVNFNISLYNFIRFFVDNGMLIIECRNNFSKKFLKNALKNFPDRTLKIILRRSVLKVKFSAFIFGIDSFSIHSILVKLRRYNKGLETHRWTVQDQININGGVNLSFIMDMISADFVINHESMLLYEEQCVKLNFVGKI